MFFLSSKSDENLGDILEGVAYGSDGLVFYSSGLKEYAASGGDVESLRSGRFVVKYKKDNYKCVFNRVLLSETTILIITDRIKTLFLNYDALNYMITRDEKFCNDVHNDMVNLIKQSTQISSVSEKQRNSFFNILLSKIEARKKYV